MATKYDKWISKNDPCEMTYQEAKEEYDRLMALPPQQWAEQEMRMEACLNRIRILAAE